MSFEKVEALVRDVTNFRIRYNTMVLKDNWLLMMVNVLNSRRIKYKSYDRIADAQVLVRKHPVFYYPKHKDFINLCWCGACVNCLSEMLNFESGSNMEMNCAC